MEAVEQTTILYYSLDNIMYRNDTIFYIVHYVYKYMEIEKSSVPCFKGRPILRCEFSSFRFTLFNIEHFTVH